MKSCNKIPDFKENCYVFAGQKVWSIDFMLYIHASSQIHIPAKLTRGKNSRFSLDKRRGKSTACVNMLAKIKIYSP
jgi:hypothetical protein